MSLALDVKIGINPISWSNDDLPSLGAHIPLETALREGAAIGYQGFELGHKFPRQLDRLKAVLAPYQLACISGWYSGRLAERTVQEEIQAVNQHLELLAGIGSPVMVYGEVANAIQGLASPLYKRPRFRYQSDWQAYGERLNEFALHLASRGVQLAYHHHMGAYVESPEDIDALMTHTGPQVGLLFDTGHASFGGGDALTLLKRHAARVVHVHCKDVRPAVLRQARNADWSFLEAVLNGAFTVPGDGALDFAALLKILAERRYKGWLVVEAEQDPAVAPSYQCAEKGFATLSGLVAAINRETAT